MNNRLKFHEKLCDLLGSRNVYFQPPETIKLSYPCIIYEMANIDTRYADDRVYKSDDRYSITIIDKNPDSSIHRDFLEKFKMVQFDRHFVIDNLHHYVLTIYY